MDKQWYQSKGIWGGLLVSLGGVATLTGQLLEGSLDLSSFLTQVVPLLGIGLGIIGIRTAEK